MVIPRAKAIPLVLAVGAIVALAAGCGGGNAAPAHAAAQAASRPASTQSAPAQAQSVVLYQAEGYAKPVAEAFTKETGIQVKIVHLATGSLAAKIQAEGRYPQWDLAWFDGASTMQALADQGLLATGWAPSDVSNYTGLGKSLLPKDDAYFPTGVSAAAAIGYNTKVLSPAQAPTDWSDLLSPRFKGAVAMNDPSISGPTYPFVAGILQQKGVQAGERFFSALKANGLQVYPKNGPTIQAMLSGKAKVALAQDAALVNFQVKGDPIRIVYPTSGTFVLPGVIGIAKNAAHRAAAEKFVAFCLTAAAQRIMVDPSVSGGDGYHIPLVAGVQPDGHVHVQGVNWVVVNPVTAADRRAKVLKWFSDTVVH